MNTRLTKRAAELKDAAVDCDGLEIPKPLWEAASELVAAEPGSFSLGPARGPDSFWKRLYRLDENGEQV